MILAINRAKRQINYDIMSNVDEINFKYWLQQNSTIQMNGSQIYVCMYIYVCVYTYTSF